MDIYLERVTVHLQNANPLSILQMCKKHVEQEIEKLRSLNKDSLTYEKGTLRNSTGVG